MVRQAVQFEALGPEQPLEESHWLLQGRHTLNKLSKKVVMGHEVTQAPRWNMFEQGFVKLYWFGETD